MKKQETEEKFLESFFQSGASNDRRIKDLHRFQALKPIKENLESHQIVERTNLIQSSVPVIMHSFSVPSLNPLKTSNSILLGSHQEVSASRDYLKILLDEVVSTYSSLATIMVSLKNKPDTYSKLGEVNQKYLELFQKMITEIRSSYDGKLKVHFM